MNCYAWAECMDGLFSQIGADIVSYYRCCHCKKCKFLYNALPILRIAQTLYFPARPVQSKAISTSLGIIQSYATINTRKLLLHISTTIGFHIAAQDSNPGPLSLTLWVSTPRIVS